MKRYILAHDLGTSGNKATLFSEDGELIASQIYAYDTDYFNVNWAEQDSMDWWRAVCETSKGIIQAAGIKNTEIAVVSFSGQMMGCLCVDRQGSPLRKAIIWADQRAQKQAAEIAEHISMYDFYRITGHRNSPSYGIQKLMWVRDNEPEIYENTYKMLNAKDFIVFKLTGNFYTEYTDGTSCNCLDINNLKWSERIIECAGIDGDKLPELKPSTFVAGGVTEEAAKATGLAAGTPVVLGGGDGLCANVGAGSISPGKTFSYVGSSAWIATTSEKPLFDEQMRTITWAHIVPGLYSPNGTMQSAGGSYSWIKNNICLAEIEQAEAEGRDVYDIINEKIELSPPGANGIIFLPYLLGERAPRWNPDAKGAFIGIKMENNRSDFLRSVLEGITMNLSIVLDVLRQQVDVEEILVIGGGAKGAVWRQIMADIYNARILVPRLLEEATSMGAAVTGGVGAGLFKDFSAIEKFIDIEYVHMPRKENFEVYAEMKKIFDSCYFALKDVFKDMTGLSLKA
jgi:xylulokinase